MIRTNAVIFRRFFVGDERFTTLTVPSLIRPLVDQSRLFELQPNILHRCLMFDVRRSDEIRRINRECLDHLLKIAIRTINITLRIHPLLSRLCRDLIAMLINARLKSHHLAELSLIPCPYVRHQIVECMPNVRRAIYIRNCGRDIGMFFRHRFIITQGRRSALPRPTATSPPPRTARSHRPLSAKNSSDLSRC